MITHGATFNVARHGPYILSVPGQCGALIKGLAEVGYRLRSGDVQQLLHDVSRGAGTVGHIAELLDADESVDVGRALVYAVRVGDLARVEALMAYADRVQDDAFDAAVYDARHRPDISAYLAQCTVGLHH
jgi:hypothetical protein